MAPRHSIAKVWLPTRKEFSKFNRGDKGEARRQSRTSGGRSEARVEDLGRLVGQAARISASKRSKSTLQASKIGIVDDVELRKAGQESARERKDATANPILDVVSITVTSGDG